MGKSAEYPFPHGEYSELEAARKGQNSEFYKELTRIPKLLGVFRLFEKIISLRTEPRATQ